MPRPSGDDSFEAEYKQWRKQNAHVFAVAAGIVGDAAVRKFLVSRGFTPFSFFIPIIIARLGAEASGLYLANLIDPDQGVKNWIRASSRIFNWGSLDDSMFGAPLALIPNPITTLDLVVDSADMIQDHVLGSHEFGLVTSTIGTMANQLGASLSKYADWYISRPQFR